MQSCQMYWLPSAIGLETPPPITKTLSFGCTFLYVANTNP
uniref:Uncharacterized protein n=1 Tax=Rhizophora mucronata TaxID=61149 RepID=A0A2P2QWC0_RHIMU